MGLTKATIRNEDTHEVITCLFNPTEYTIAKSNSWQPRPIVGRNVPQLDFTGGGSATMTLELFFDVYEQPGGDVTILVNKLWDLTKIDETSRNPRTRRSRPPLCTFQWGGQWSFKAAVTSLSVRYTLFRQDGTPVRAVASVSLMEAEDATTQPGQNPTSHAVPGYKRREVRAGETLAGIAFEEYGDPNHWRDLARANGIEDPSSMRPGDLISVPPISS